jgi:carbamoyltransferase
MATGRHCLGIHIGHDRGAALVSDGVLSACVAEERLDRRKHSPSPNFPAKSIRACLQTAGLQASDLAGVGISYTNVRVEDIIGQLQDEIRDVLGVPGLPVIGVGHHECHAWSTWCTSGFEKSLIMVADGAGDIVGTQIEAESVYEGRGGKLILVEQRLQDFGLTRTDRRNAFNPAYMLDIDRIKPISLGRKYEQFTYLIGFGHDEAGKTMGLAAYDTPMFRMNVPAFEGLQFPLTFAQGLEEVASACNASGKPWHKFILENRIAIAAAVQALIEDYMVACVNNFTRAAEHEVMCAAGGLFLNCKMNHELLNRTGLSRLHVFPAAGDDGQCVGAAFAAYNTFCETPHVVSLRNVFLGPQYDESTIVERLRHFKLSAKRFDDEWLADRVAEDLSRGRFVGLFRGRSEIGPRALCHRSILADPRRDGVRDCLNRIKGRELFRPFAPVVSAEDQFKYFDLKQESPYMLFATTPKPEYAPLFPGVVHVDGTSRVQAVEATQDPFMHGLLKSFQRLCGHPVLLNTSFNLAGDPIVETPHDAITTFLASDLDVLVLDNYYIESKAPLHDRRASE